jgi:hypothetical protein
MVNIEQVEFAWLSNQTAMVKKKKALLLSSWSLRSRETNISCFSKDCFAQICVNKSRSIILTNFLAFRFLSQSYVQMLEKILNALLFI